VAKFVRSSNSEMAMDADRADVISTPIEVLLERAGLPRTRLSRIPPLRPASGKIWQWGNTDLLLCGTETYTGLERAHSARQHPDKVARPGGNRTPDRRIRNPEFEGPDLSTLPDRGL